MRTNWIIVAVGLVFCSGVSDVVAEGADFKPRVVIPRAFPAIKDFVVVAGAGAGEKVVRDEELVLGVVVGGKSRAYPINQLTGPRREIINDKLGGVAIAATW